VSFSAGFVGTVVPVWVNGRFAFIAIKKTSKLSNFILPQIRGFPG